MHKCMIAIGLTVQIQAHRRAGFVQQSLCNVSLRPSVCVRASGVLYIQLTVSQSIFPVLPAPYCLSVCVSCTLAYLSEAAQTHLAVQPKARQRRCVPNTRAMFNSHANVEPRGDAMSDFKKTRKERLQDLQRHSLGSTSAGLTVSENIFNNSTWWIEKPKTQRGAF